ncbi:hypothetical protein [Roseateles amylovorans]|uniref:Uncharacterized protein n=1 Tax=Roseateles amylovorans TaxID=2978473 RepID=A0ABY6B1B5_9BURK|nr:hypothetical protein [Roseateles amylovorans]UXH77779.1 hypothetical protein N4261_22835 [Roseateles amylovorans]
MKKLLISASLALTALFAGPALAGDVGISVSIGQPGFYGQINVGNQPPPAVVYAEPVMVERVYAPAPPVYLRVPPNHLHAWSRHCGYYGACGRRVYFVREDWYARTYAPAYYGRPVARPYPVYGPAPHWERREWDRRGWDDRRGWEDRRSWDDRRGGDDRRGWDDRRGGHERRDWDDRRGDRGDRGERGEHRGRHDH